MLTLSGLLRLPSFGLLLSLAALILLEPLAGHLSGAVPLLATLHLSVLWLAVRLVSSTRDELTVTRLLAAPTILLNLGSLIVEQPALAMADLAMRTVFYAHVIRCLLAYVLRDAVVTVDELFAATCAYVLLAMLFACVYALLEMQAAGSFSVPAASDSGRATRWDLLYFSFTVLTSTGFGDIHPLARQAQSVVVIEQVTA
jgi:Ion channel